MVYSHLNEIFDNNRSVPGYPKVTCELVKCPDPYMGLGVQPGAPPDITKGAQDPFGAGGKSFVEYGYCPRDKPFPDELSVIKELSYAKLHAFDKDTHGQFFWNFRTEFEPRWDYLKASDNGWFPTDWESDETKSMISFACEKFAFFGSAESSPNDNKNRMLVAFSLAILFGSILLFVRRGVSSYAKSEYIQLDSEVEMSSINVNSTDEKNLIDKVNIYQV